MSSNNDVDFSKFGKSFQEKLAQLILFDKPFSLQIEEVLKNSYFEPDHLKVFVKHIFTYRADYQEQPSKGIVGGIIESDNTLDPLVKSQLREFYNKFIDVEDPKVSESSYVKDKALDFCKKQSLKEAMVESIDLLDKCSFDEISQVINNAISLGLDNNYGYDYERDFEERFNFVSRSPISTGWQLIDSITAGGLGRGELAVIIAPTGVGKTWALAHWGSQAILLGKTVVHYTLEISDTATALRYDTCIMGMPAKDLFTHKKKVLKRVQSIKGTLIVKEYPTKSASTATIKNHLNKLQQRDIIPDVVIVDYGDLLKPVAQYKEKRAELESIYEELRAIAQEYNCSVITASQVHRAAVEAEVITMDAISEAFAKCFVADFIISLSRTRKDKVSNTGRIFVAKNRNGPDGIVFPIFMDTATGQIKVLRSEEEGEDVESNTSPMDNIRKKYQNHLKEEK